MPELPEVETCRRIVERELAGLTVERTAVRLPKLLRFSEIPALQTIEGHKVLGARRRAKLLIVDFSDELTLITHFKLAGQLSVHRPGGRRVTAGHPVPNPDGPYPHKSTHIDITFDDGTVLYLSDIRQFGWLRLMPSDRVDAEIAAFSFGPEGIGTDRITFEQLRSSLQRRSIPIKLALLDQGLVAGIGNIYADEALHRARIHPGTPANLLSNQATGRLWEGIRWALERGIELGGATIVHQKAYPVNGFPAVHGRQHEPCPVCGALIRKIKVGTRGTYYCPKCQKKPAARKPATTPAS